MLFFVLTLAPQAGFGSLILPAQIGARRMAFPAPQRPRFLALRARVLRSALLASFVPGGSAISGWTAYPPLSAVTAAGPGQGLGMDLWLVSIWLFGTASILSAVNTIATIIAYRCPGMTWERLPLTVWGWFTAALLTVIAFSVLLAALLMLFLDRHAHTSFFIPAGDLVSTTLHSGGNGSPLLWLHLFWFFGHPEVYIAILPGMGLTSMLLANFCRRRIFGYRMMILTTLLIGFLGILVWGHHMFVAGLNPFASTAFSVSTMAIALPASAKVLSWLATIWRSRPVYKTPDALRARIRLALHLGWINWADSGPADSRSVPAQHLLRRRALPPHHVNGWRLRPLLRHLLLVPSAHLRCRLPRAADERNARPLALLAIHHRSLRNLPAHAPRRTRRQSAPLRAAQRHCQRRI